MEDYKLTSNTLLFNLLKRTNNHRFEYLFDENLGVFITNIIKDTLSDNIDNLDILSYKEFVDVIYGLLNVFDISDKVMETIVIELYGYEAFNNESYSSIFYNLIYEDVSEEIRDDIVGLYKFVSGDYSIEDIENNPAVYKLVKNIDKSKRREIEDILEDTSFVEKNIPIDDIIYDIVSYFFDKVSVEDFVDFIWSRLKTIKEFLTGGMMNYDKQDLREWFYLELPLMYVSEYILYY